MFAKLVMIAAITIMALSSASLSKDSHSTIKPSKFAEFKKGIYTGMKREELSSRYKIKQSYLGGNTFDIMQPELIDNKAKIIRILFDNNNRAYEIIVNFGEIWDYFHLKDVLIGVYGKPNTRGETIWRNGDNIISYKSQYHQGSVYQILSYKNNKLSSLFDQYKSKQYENDRKNRTKKDVNNWN
ncbi:MAG: hypothetical protein K8S18_05860 [Desulfobacula sp.]|nr:hypothetical protein [Desulfobacula sp.]